ncbi:type III secretion system outer membrane ring subunit SctC [Erwinia pyrifoliae]|uniref:Type 3 secretion system secretin n=1 Tax=Erwinia pyrifoliae TaxID=79967 RepID=A0ABY5X6Y0_ERWPY|nr:type III secretion system outer membrane ring subunit SctC [Erwinia pyrifoliae]AUX71541.1 EscC/YscC/HrcC family type III secretion system outer membrane ring protein [Erwinia pyrifoliae]MCA8878239.1 EscC/YscC/HrcC family type III secretion system outer membrane ring protein [Erwinia pyrifoliae]UWS33111.1 type III secretion system outer membrane ring subunit SctC [Erwinia pyrifoliae]UXK12878.1 type III secretion system outer membrane ring subunit SctC [Erwinia pyrifoliae]CAX56853.1 hrp/hrc T
MVEKRALRCRLLGALLMLCATLPAGAQTPADWKEQSYAYSADRTPLSTVLQDFADGHSVDLQLGNVEDAEVTAKIRADNASAFLDRLALEHHFQWFVYNNTLYVSPQDEQSSERLEISPDAAPDIKQALSGIGLLDPRFGWGELPDDGVVLVTGPPQYLELVKRFSEQREKKEDRRKVMTFPLRYASVADRTIHYRDQTVVIPGVATMLNELMNGKRAAPASASGSDSAPGGPDTTSMMQNTQTLLSRLSSRNKSANKAGGRDSDIDDVSGRISADVRNNALLIRDDDKRRDEYSQLIAKIDVPQNLVEIDAVILDIDRTALNRLEANWQATLGGVTGGSSLMSGSGTLFVSDFKRFFADIQALEGEGTASIVANPSVLTLENQPAVIDFSQTAYITATGERVADIQPVTAGTSLQVTPRAVGNQGHSSIQLMIDIEDGHVQTNGDGQATGVKRGTVSTQALISENRALVLGGFHVEESADRDRRIPLLGDIPWIGQLFSSRRHEISQRQRLFILTPRLIGDQTDPTRYVTADNRQQLSDAMGRVERRHSNVNQHDVVENALRDLAEGQSPAGFQVQTSGTRLSEVCRSTPSLLFESTRGQWYSSSTNGVHLSVGVVRNISSKPLRFDEANCASKRTLAVAVWPHSALAPGESAEVYLATDPSRVLRASRESLLNR